MDNRSRASTYKNNTLNGRTELNSEWRLITEQLWKSLLFFGEASAPCHVWLQDI